ncbi:MAG TPA: GNAT family N-acetyltransferase [Chryseolinea sp.]
MEIQVQKATLQDVLILRRLFLQENNFQIRYDSCHARGWSDSYIVWHNGLKIGYGSVKGYDKIEDRDAVFEFYIIPVFRNLAPKAFEELLKVSGASFIECQTNDSFLASFAYTYGTHLSSDTILFSDSRVTHLPAMDAIFRPSLPDDKVFEHRAEPPGNFVVEWQGEVVATGGFLLHYNMPFADIYMEAREDSRRKGFGSFLVQEVKVQCYLSGRVPAARTGSTNLASKATLLRAGLSVAGHILLARVK